MMAKQEAELTIFYNFYVDCMPSDDMAEASGRRVAGGYFAHAKRGVGVGTVSYTHLTLPTKA